MQIADLMKSVASEIPSADMRSFLKLAYRKLLDVANLKCWRYYETTQQFDLTASVTIEDCTVTNGDATVTSTNASFVSGMVGRKVRFQGAHAKTYEVATFTSTTSIELTETFAGTTATDATAVVYVIDYDLNANCQRIRNIQNMTYAHDIKPVGVDDLLFAERQAGTFVSKPLYYACFGYTDSTGKRKIRFNCPPDSADTIRINYLRRPAEPSGPATEVDAPTELEYILLDEMVIHFMHRPENAKYLNPNRLQFFMAQLERHQRAAMNNDNLVSRNVYHNLPTNFVVPTIYRRSRGVV